MLRSSRRGILSAALIIGALSGCSQLTDEYDNVMGISRTTPEGANVDFKNRHAPVLNNVIPTEGSSGDDARDIYSPQNVGQGPRHVPAENNDSSSNNAVGGGVTQAAVPVAPVTAAGDTAYQSLANVPPAPTYTPKDQSTAEFNSLTADRNQSESSRKQLMSDPNATVMTSPQTGQLVSDPANAMVPEAVITPPVPMQPVPQAAVQHAPAPVPQTAKEDGGFNSWLHHLFPSDNQNNAAPVNSARETPSENSGSPVASTVASAQSPHDLMAAPAVSPAYASMPVSAAEPVPADEVLHLVPPGSHNPSPVPEEMSELPVPASVSVPAAPAVAGMEPVHLHPPVATAEDNQVAPVEVAPVADAAASAEQPITLVPPPAASSQTHYLADSRYAARRMQAPADDSDNSN